MKKKIITFAILGFMTFFVTGCTKYTYDIEIDKKNKVSFKEVLGINKNIYKYTLNDYEKVTNTDFKTLEKQALAKGFEFKPYEDENFKGIVKTKGKIKIKELNNSVLPAGFTTEGRAPVFIVKNCIMEKYIISLKYNIYDAKDVHKFLIKKYRTNEETKNIIKEKMASEIQEKTNEEAKKDSAENPQVAEQNVAQQETQQLEEQQTEAQEQTKEQEDKKLDEELEKILVPEVQLKIKIPKKASKHNATKVLNDYEYVWNLDAKDSVEINLEYQKPNIPSIIILVFILIGGITLLKFYLKNREE